MSYLFAPIVLLSAGVLALIVAAVVRRRSAPGRTAFCWLNLAVAEWSIAAALHWLATGYDAKYLLAQTQYIGIVGVAPLWLLFAGAYAGKPLVRHRRVVVALWLLPIVTLGAVLTAPSHTALWTQVIVSGRGPGTYVHGWWFWTFAAYSYLLVLVGTAWLMAVVRQSPHQRAPLIALIVAAFMPWLANVVYLARLLPLGGLDPTPVGFAASALLLTWALYRRGLFDLVPVARDQLIDNITDAVLVVDHARRLLDMNRAALRLSGDPPAWHGRPVDDLFPYLAGTALSDHVTAEVDATPGGASYDVRVAQVHSASGTSVGWLVVLRDVTDQRRAASEREALARQKTQFLSTVSHELRTPMFSIRGSLQLVLGSSRTMLAAEDRKLLTIALSTTERLVRIVNNLLDLSAIEAQQFALRQDLISVDELIADALSDVSQEARHASVHLQSGVPLGPPALVGDRDRLVQALVNLLSNAVKVSPSGSVVSIDAHAEGDLVCVGVRDHGPGISQEVVHRLFERYQPLDAALSHGTGGSGLGLAIAKTLVEQHGGHIRVDSVPGEGSTFVVCVPRAAEGLTANVPPPRARPAPMADAAVRPARVLVADDEPDVREVLAEALQRRGFTVLTAADGDEAIQILRRTTVDAAVLDLHMPRMNGSDVIRHVRTEGRQPDLPIVILTGAVEQVDSAELLRANTLLSKPADIRRLLAAVEELLPPLEPR